MIYEGMKLDRREPFLVIQENVVQFEVPTGVTASQGNQWSRQESIGVEEEEKLEEVTHLATEEYASSVIIPSPHYR